MFSYKNDTTSIPRQNEWLYRETVVQSLHNSGWKQKFKHQRNYTKQDSSCSKTDQKTCNFILQHFCIRRGGVGDWEEEKKGGQDWWERVRFFPHPPPLFAPARQAIIAKRVKHLTIIPWAWMGSESIAQEAEGRMGYWIRGHEGERNNCFSKIQLVGQKYQE